MGRLRDVDQARIEIAVLAQEFVKAEGFAHVKGRADRWRSVAIYTSDGQNGTPVHAEFDVATTEDKRVTRWSNGCRRSSIKRGSGRDVALAVVAQLGARYAAELSPAAQQEEAGMIHHHVLGLSGGRDSAALAVYMRQNHPEIDTEYFFTDTGKELPEVYDFLGGLEGFLGKPILRLNPDRDFDFWLTQYKHFLPSPQTPGVPGNSRSDRLRSG